MQTRSGNAKAIYGFMILKANIYWHLRRPLEEINFAYKMIKPPIFKEIDYVNKMNEAPLLEENNVYIKTEYSSKTVNELGHIVCERGMVGYSKLRKGILLRRLADIILRVSM